MSTRPTERAEIEATSGERVTVGVPRPSRIRSTVQRFGWLGRAATLAGGLLLAGAVLRGSRNTRRAGVLGLVGGALLLVGLRRRRSADGSTAGGDGGETSAEAEAHRERSDAMHQSEANPRGVSGEPDVETRTDPEEGAVRFSEERGGGPGPKPALDRSGEDDPRRPDVDDPATPADHVEVDLSEAAMADEASEATGPDPEQAYPAMEGTDPEPTSPAAPDREDDRSVAGGDAGPGTGTGTGTGNGTDEVGDDESADRNGDST